MNNIPRKCPKCNCTDLTIYSYHGIALNYDDEADVCCRNCGIIGSVTVKITPRKGTYTEG